MRCDERPTASEKGIFGSLASPKLRRGGYFADVLDVPLLEARGIAARYRDELGHIPQRERLL